MDGVLVDFYSYFRKRGQDIEGQHYFLQPRSEWTKEQVAQDEYVKREMSRPGFFANLPKMPGASRLWKFCREGFVNTNILTASPKYLPELWDQVSNDKYVWVTDNLGSLLARNFHCVQSMGEKVKYAAENHILVDDIEKNIDEWRGAGGIGVHFKNTSQAIRELEQYSVYV